MHRFCLNLFNIYYFISSICCFFSCCLNSLSDFFRALVVSIHACYIIFFTIIFNGYSVYSSMSLWNRFYYCIIWCLVISIYYLHLYNLLCNCCINSITSLRCFLNTNSPRKLFPGLHYNLSIIIPFHHHFLILRVLSILFTSTFAVSCLTAFSLIS